MIQRLSELQPNQAWWAVCRVLPDGTSASEVITKATETGISYTVACHVVYDQHTGLYDVMLKI